MKKSFFLLISTIFSLVWLVIPIMAYGLETTHDLILPRTIGNEDAPLEFYRVDSDGNITLDEENSRVLSGEQSLAFTVGILNSGDNYSILRLLESITVRVKPDATGTLPQTLDNDENTVEMTTEEIGLLCDGKRGLLYSENNEWKCFPFSEKDVGKFLVMDRDKKLSWGNICLYNCNN